MKKMVALNKVAAEKRMCPPEGTLTEFFYQKDQPEGEAYFHQVTILSCRSSNHSFFFCFFFKKCSKEILHQVKNNHK